MSELKQGTWVVVADGEKALIFRNLTDHENPNFELLEEIEQDNLPNRDQKTHKAGRMQDTGVQQRSAVEDTDFHRLEQDRFAADLADKLYERVHSGAFEHLVLVAAPAILGEMREKMHQEVEKRIVFEIPKTLTNHPPPKIEKIVKAEMDGA